MFANEDEEKTFILGLKLPRKLSTYTDCGFSYVNDNIPIEIILMYLKAFIKEHENKFFDKYNARYDK